ncbi:MAG: type III secretion system chaperone [Kiritimatiellae bacterium]|nr:type III secretion system chaperone [Kiritimatiellia bacterium]
MNTLEDYKRFLADVRKQTGIESLAPDAAGLVSVRVEDRFNVNLQFVEATGKVLCFVEVAQLPADTSKDVYRDLLAGGLFGKETAGGYFALEPDTETVVYNYFFDLDRAAEDPEDFVDTIEKILQLCDLWAERIKAPGGDGGPSGDEVPDLQAFRIHA